MAKRLIEDSTLKGLADALRKITGETRSYTPTEMIDAVTHIMETGAYILVDNKGNEIPAVFLENERVFTATANDIRLGTTAVTESGVTEGSKEIPAYYVSEGYRLVDAGADFTLPHAEYDYAKMQAVFCAFNTNFTNSVATDKVAIDDFVYAVSSTSALSEVTKDDINEKIVFGISNETDKRYLIRYFMYKETY